MICRTSEEKKSERLFRSRIKPYLKVKKPRSVRTSRKHRPRREDGWSLPDSDVSHLFNHEAMLAVSHAIEDLAGHIGEGELISTFQHVDHFRAQRERYLELAKRLDAVRVWAEGEPPHGSSSIDFIPIFHPELTRYWVVLFDSEEIHAVLFCKQANGCCDFPKKIFSGFYSFNPFLVRCIRRRFSLLACGMDGVVSDFERLFSPTMPDPLEDIESLLHPA
ncbi:hypothetical protein EBX31_11210 [bacterium]|nr:hypothetical protein [bacterium]